jgi:hypothetical protein
LFVGCGHGRDALYATTPTALPNFPLASFGLGGDCANARASTQAASRQLMKNSSSTHGEASLRHARVPDTSRVTRRGT